MLKVNPTTGNLDLVVDDHIKLSNIGTNTHVQIDTHIANNSIHQAKYTDAEAVAAADASDHYLERNIINAVTGSTTIERSSLGEIMQLKLTSSNMMVLAEPLVMMGKSTNTTKSGIYYDMKFPNFKIEGTDGSGGLGYIKMYKAMGGLASNFDFVIASAGGSSHPILSLYNTSVDVKNHPIKNIKNHSASALSGTKKLIELLIGSTPYYFEVYPNKA